MTVKELIALLGTYPMELEVYFQISDDCQVYNFPLGQSHLGIDKIVTYNKGIKYREVLLINVE